MIPRKATSSSPKARHTPETIMAAVIMTIEPMLSSSPIGTASKASSSNRTPNASRNPPWKIRKWDARAAPARIERRMTSRMVLLVVDLATTGSPGSTRLAASASMVLVSKSVDSTSLLLHGETGQDRARRL
ncbi:hypothetical protein [Paludisphaera mucosa]|uniref:Uncharacterized protein n=1 Tax=Paludisphaera mucosa TaxID=3030827 RepID=A0ABT6F9J0_9BACT|nr:hypothetical protein [Paludisphaera mucosa]MDG3004260.1 hypothetical protein [Paludisphaera mucosa]